MAHNFSYGHVQTTNARFAGIFLDDQVDDLVWDRYMPGRNSVVFQLLRNQVPLGDFPFFLHEVTRHFDDFHPVAQRTCNRAEVIGCGDEHHFRQIIVDIQKIIVKTAVLFRVEHFQQGRLRIPPEIVTHFIDLIQNENRIRSSCFFDTLKDSSRHSSDIGLPVSPDFRFIVQST